MIHSLILYRWKTNRDKKNFIYLRIVLYLLGIDRVFPGIGIEGPTASFSCLLLIRMELVSAKPNFIMMIGTTLTLSRIVTSGHPFHWLQLLSHVLLHGGSLESAV